MWSPSGDHLIVSLDEGLEGERYDDGWWSFTVDKTSVAALREGCDMVTQGAPYPQILHELHGSGSIAYNSDLGQRVSAVAVSGGCVYVLLEKICLPWHNSSGEPSEIPQLLKFK